MAQLNNILCVFMVLWLTSVKANNCIPTKAMSSSHVLRQKIFCEYDKAVRPVKNHSNITLIEVDIRVMFLFFQEQWNTLNVHSWVRYIWTDEHLTWDPSEHDYIGSIQISTSDIWVPDIAVYNSADSNGMETSGEGRLCWLLNTGSITCVVPTVHSATCSADITNWPFDSHNCSIRLGSWTHFEHQINLTLGKKEVSMKESHGFYQNRIWELLSVSAYRQSDNISLDNISWLSFNYVLKRHSGTDAVTVVIPAIVLATMILLVFCLDSQSVERLSLVCLDILCVCLYLMYLGEMLPSNADRYPVILLFYRDSLLIALVTLVISVLVRKMDTTISPPPTWVKSCANSMLATLPGKVFLFATSDGKEPLENEENHQVGRNDLSSKNSCWRIFGKLLDSICFLVVFLTFNILWTRFLP